MKFECNEGGAWAVVLVGVAACISFAFTIVLSMGESTKAECHRAQQAAYKASAPAPDCKK